MKREIKFRFWNPDKFMMDDHKGWREDIGINEAIEASEQYGYKTMQFTGLTDKNGTEIYEGDIVSFEDDPAGVVKWNSNFCCYTYWESKHINDEYESMDWNQLLKKDCNHYIVHGNIYENPDLLL